MPGGLHRRVKPPFPTFPLFVPQNFEKELSFDFSQDHALYYPREIKNNGYAKYWWANKVHYGRYANGEWAVLELTGT